MKKALSRVLHFLGLDQPSSGTSLISYLQWMAACILAVLGFASTMLVIVLLIVGIWSAFL